MNQKTYVPISTMIENVEFQDMLLSIQTEGFRCTYYVKNPDFSLEDNELDIISENNQLTFNLLDDIIMYDDLENEYCIKIPGGEIVISIIANIENAENEDSYDIFG